MKGKVEEYKRKLEKYEKQKEEEAKAFSIDEVLADSARIYRVYVPELKCEVAYGPITMGDLAEINRAKTDEERATLILWKMLSKADENVTLEKVQQLPIETATPILNAITRPLVSIAKKSNVGSRQILQLKQ